MSRGYIFKGYKNFSMFCGVNYEKLFSQEEEGSVELAKNQIDMFTKSVSNTIGGCPCNAAKRRTTAHKIYKETAEFLEKNEEVKKRILSLLNDPEEVIFLNGKDDGNPEPPSATPTPPIARLKIINPEK